jgi:hypothetical protein
LPASSFPVGVAKPWVETVRGEVPLNFNADANVIGPTGLPALRISSHHAWWIARWHN